MKFLRPEKKFGSIEELQKQILKDAQEARRAVLGDGKGGVQAILFDFDDTLQDRPKAFLQYCSFFLNKYFPALSGEEKEARAQEMLRRNNHGYVNYIDYFMRLIEDWQWKDAPEVGDIYREFQFRFPEYSTLFPDTADTLRALRGRGYRLGIITNGPSIQQNRKLDVSGLRPLVDLCIVSGDEQVHKPDPEIFRRAAARLGVGCANCAYVGDHLVNDIQGAAAAGMRPRLYQRLWPPRRSGKCDRNPQPVRAAGYFPVSARAGKFFFTNLSAGAILCKYAYPVSFTRSVEYARIRGNHPFPALGLWK